jgi:type II secretory pathway predicted ATPase ExeA
MYEAFFGMKNTPFVRNVPESELFETRSTKEALARLRYAADRELFAVLTADAGCGKSTLLRRFNSSLPKDKYVLLYISDSKLTPKWLYKNLLDQLGLEAGFYRGDAKRLLQKQVEIIRSKEHRKVVCILDEAHLLERETLEEFRFLLNSNFDSESKMALILAGQTELWDQKLRYQCYAAIRQRIDINVLLPHLDRPETAQYIDCHLRYSGCAQNLFTDRAVDEIFKVSGGIPRMINRVCEKSLTYASQQNNHLVDDRLIQYVENHEMLGVEEA